MKVRHLPSRACAKKMAAYTRELGPGGFWLDSRVIVPVQRAPQRRSSATETILMQKTKREVRRNSASYAVATPLVAVVGK